MIHRWTPRSARLLAPPWLFTVPHVDFFPTSLLVHPKIFADASNNGSTRSLSHGQLVVEPAHEVLDNLSSLDEEAIKKREDTTGSGGFVF